MQTKEIELSVGDAILIGDRIVTLVDIEDDEAAFRIDYVASTPVESNAVSSRPPSK